MIFKYWVSGTNKSEGLGAETPTRSCFEGVFTEILPGKILGGSFERKLRRWELSFNQILQESCRFGDYTVTISVMRSFLHLPLPRLSP